MLHCYVVTVVVVVAIANTVTVLVFNTNYYYYIMSTSHPSTPLLPYSATAAALQSPTLSLDGSGRPAVTCADGSIVMVA